MKDFDWLILSTLYSCRNISRAAEILYTTQPNLTKRLRLIEDELGVQIVVRLARGVAFTPQGEYLAVRAREIVGLIEETKNRLSDIEDGHNTIRLAAPNSFTRNELPEILNQFRQKYRKAKFELKSCLSNEIPMLLKRGEIEAGFVHGNLNFHDEAFLLFHEILYVVSGEKLDIEELPCRPQVAYVRSPLTLKIIDDWWRQRFSAPPNVVLRVSHGDICRELVCQGLGYGLFFGNNFIEDDRHLYRLVAMRDATTPVLRETWMIFDRSGCRRTAVRNFVEFIREWKETRRTSPELRLPFR